MMLPPNETRPPQLELIQIGPFTRTLVNLRDELNCPWLRRELHYSFRKFHHQTYISLPGSAEGNLIGYINNVDIADSTITAQVITSENGSTRVEATVRNVPPAAANYLQHLISLLTPVYWTTAHEVDGAYNGYTLTNGEFMREVQVEFATGEILKMSHYANGVDSKGTLLFDVIIRGEVPELGSLKMVRLAPYQEEYIQTGPGTVYAYSSRLLSADGITLPYAWNHTITYDDVRGRMPYLVQELSTKNLNVEIIPDQQAVRYTLEASIGPGNPSNRCPDGFQHDARESFCRDNDECVQANPCSHNCHNTAGSFSCSCPIGFLLTSDARTCQDINECSIGVADCGPTLECLNTQGSFRCISQCSAGFEREKQGESCVDINECEKSPSVCAHTCLNLVGSYRCSCSPGFRLDENGRCIDLNECELAHSPCSHECTNTPGSYRCSCPPGYQLLNGRVCRDINECFEGGSNCRQNEECINNEGSFHCVHLCPPGFKRTESGRCQDIDECVSRQHRCYYNQRCINTEGAYRCDCPPGFTSRGPGQPCNDVDECLQSPRVCSYRCHNTWGSYECVCPPGQLQLADRKSCAGLEFLEPGRVLPVPEDQTFQEMVEAQEEWQPPPHRAVSFPGADGSQSRLNIQKRARHRQHQQLHEDLPPMLVQEEIPEQSQALSLATGHQRRSNHGFDRTYTYHSPWRTVKVAPKYQRYLSYSNSQQPQTRPRRSVKLTSSSCPEGFTRSAVNKSSCIDRNECMEGRSVCQHNCTNTRGSYVCTCPPGYRLDSDGYSCKDIDECVEDRVNCGPERMCFNQRGSYSCIDIPCPPDYARDPTTNFCVLECVNPNIPCPPGAKYADVIEFRTIALPGGNLARQDLIRLTAYNQHDEYLPQTMFTMLQNDPKLEFHLRVDEGRGIVYTLEPLTDGATYRITVRARSYDNHRRHIQYQTTFIIHISVSAFPY